MKNLKKILIVLAFLGSLLNTSVMGQGWEKIIPDSIGEYTSPRILATEDGGCLIVYGFIYSENNPAIIDSSNLVMTRLNVEGETLWTKQYDIPAYLAFEIKLTPDDKYLITADNGYVLKTDRDGEVEFIRQYPIFNYYTYFSFAIEAFETAQEEVVTVTNILGDFSPTIFLENENDTFQNVLQIDTSTVEYYLKSAELTLDNHLILFGDAVSPTYGVDSIDLLLVKSDFYGNPIWTKQYDFDPRDIVHGIKQLSDSTYVGIFSTYINTALQHTKFIKFDTAGNIDTVKNILTGEGGNLSHMEVTNGDEIIITWWKTNNGNYIPKIMRLDNDGDIIWSNTYGSDLQNEFMEDLTESSDRNIYAVGITNPNLDQQRGNLYLIKTDLDGNSWTNYITGNIFYDTLINCQLDSVDIPLDGWVVSARTDSLITDNTMFFYDATDAQGNYEIRTDTGTFTIKTHIPNAYWSACFNDSTINMATYVDSVNVDFPILAQYNCPILNVDVSTPFLRRGYNNIYYINYCNEGTTPAENAYVEVEFDEWLIIDSSSVDWDSVNEQVYTFDIGNVAVGECGGFQVYVTLDLDSTVLGQTHCVSAHIYPDSICLPENTNWDGSTIIVEGECLGDSLEFKIQNVGDNPMSEIKTYIITEDVVLHSNGTFQLDVNESHFIKFAVDTAFTYRLEAEQASYHPTSTAPSVTIEGCGNLDSLSLGFVNNYSEDDADPFISMDCQENIGSYDPNDKRGFPEGIGNDHIIFDDTELEYHIRFQNTGTDTAFLVVIRDTLSPYLDLTTVRPRASSHPYTWTLQNNGALKFKFENIMLPDSNINEIASHGFVKFKAAQRAGNLPGTIITNQVGIYFDFNAPVITNQTMHMIENPQSQIGTDTLYFCNDTFYTQDTIIMTDSSQLSWNLAMTTTILLSTPYDITIDSVVEAGQVPYSMDTTVIQNLISVAGCDSTVTINYEIIVGIDNLENTIKNIRLFPNPAQQQVNVIINSTETKEFIFTLKNNLGQELEGKKIKQKMKAGINTVFMNLAGLAEGIYWLEIKSKTERHTVKVVIQRL